MSISAKPWRNFSLVRLVKLEGGNLSITLQRVELKSQAQRDKYGCKYWYCLPVVWGLHYYFTWAYWYMLSRAREAGSPVKITSTNANNWLRNISTWLDEQQCGKTTRASTCFHATLRTSESVWLASDNMYRRGWKFNPTIQCDRLGHQNIFVEKCFKDQK